MTNKKNSKELFALIIVLSIGVLLLTNLSSSRIDPNDMSNVYYPVEMALHEGRMADIIGNTFVSFDGQINDFLVTVSGHDESNIFPGDDVHITAKVVNVGSESGEMWVQCSIFPGSHNSLVGREGYVSYYLSPDSNCQGYEPNTQTAQVFVAKGETFYVPFVVKAMEVGENHISCSAYERCWSPTQDPYLSSEDWKGPITVNNPSSCVKYKCYNEDLYCYTSSGTRLVDTIIECDDRDGCDESTNTCNSCKHRDYLACYDDGSYYRPYWYDSCGNRENINDTCESDEVCVNGYCTGGSSTLTCYYCSGDAKLTMVFSKNSNNQVVLTTNGVSEIRSDLSTIPSSCADFSTSLSTNSNLVCGGGGTVPPSSTTCYSCDDITLVTKPLSELKTTWVFGRTPDSCEKAYKVGTWFSNELNCAGDNGVTCYYCNYEKAYDEMISSIVFKAPYDCRKDNRLHSTDEFLICDDSQEARPYFINPINESQFCSNYYFGADTRYDCYERKEAIEIKELERLGTLTMSEYKAMMKDINGFMAVDNPICLLESNYLKIGDVMCEEGSVCLAAINKDGEAYKYNKQVYDVVKHHFFGDKTLVIFILKASEAWLTFLGFDLSNDPSTLSYHVENTGICTYEDQTFEGKTGRWFDTLKASLLEALGIEPESEYADIAWYGAIGLVVLLLFLLLRPPAPRVVR